MFQRLDRYHSTDTVMGLLLAQSRQSSEITSLSDSALPPEWVIEALRSNSSRKNARSGNGKRGDQLDEAHDGSSVHKTSRWGRNLSSLTTWPNVTTKSVEDMELLICSSPALRLASACVADAAGLSPSDFQHETTRAYEQIRQAISCDSGWFPLRFWNYIPDIHAPAGRGLDRYMVFNAGRFEAFSRWYGGIEGFADSVATASGLGHDGRDLVIHVLAGRSRGQHVENPRQVPSYRYSQRYGPLPPCFARATLTRLGDVDRPWLLIGGTSSVRGEASVRTGDVILQSKETMRNLSSLIASAADPHKRPTDDRDTRHETLSQLRHVRVYAKHREDVHAILTVLHDNAPHLKPAEIEVLRADICRPELLVEVEGTAQLEPGE